MSKFKILFNTLKKAISFSVNTITSHLSLSKFKILLVCFGLGYTVFFIFISYLLYKSYLLNIDGIKEFIYSNMYTDIAKLNSDYPIRHHDYHKTIPTPEQISQIYFQLHIPNYQEYIYNLSPTSESLHSILDSTNDKQIESKVSSMVFADIIHQNVSLFDDFAKHLLKRVIRYSAPLIISSVLLAAVCVVEHLNPVDIAIAVQI